DADPGSEHAARRFALGAGRLDRSAAARWHRIPEGGRLCHHHRLISSCVAVVLQHRCGGQSLQGRARAPGAQLLHRSRGAGRPARQRGTAARPAEGPKRSDPHWGSPANRYKFDPAKGKALLAEAGYTPAKPLSFKMMISNSGSGQMLPLPMNEFLQQNLKEACGVNVDFDVVEWQVLLTAARATPDSPSLQGTMGLNVSSPSSDAGVMARYFSS